MSISRIFLGWDGPCLPRVVQWLEAAHVQGGSFDLSEVLLVTPGRRSGRRLVELLVQEAAGLELRPPTFATIGELPEHLYPSPPNLIDPLHMLLARQLALRQADRDAMACAIPTLPDDGDMLGWLALAEEFDQLYTNLSAEAVRFGDVPQRAAAMIEFADEERWQALAQLQAQYEQLLAERNWCDLHQARFNAIDNHACTSTRHIVVIAAPDLSQIARQMLAALTCPVTVMVHAPESEAAHFDELGAPIAEHWAERRLNLDRSQVRLVDRPRDQAMEVLRVLSEGDAAGVAPRVVDQVTVGLGDDAAGPMIERTLELAGVPARQAVGMAVAQSRPALLLTALTAFLEHQRLSDLADLLRHADIESWLLSRVGESKPWLTQLDDYISRHLQGPLPIKWLGSERHTAALNEACRELQQLVPPDAGKRRPLPQWARPISQLLSQVYDARPLRRHDEDDEPIIDALDRMGRVLRELAELDENDAVTPRTTLAEAATFVVHQLADQHQPADGHHAAVELLGWLELQLDDAATLIITGMNEGSVPQSANADAFLPDSVRKALGLMDNTRRYARDRMMLEAMLNSRPSVALVAGRRTASGDPLMPSRLLLACDDEKLATWVKAFYEHADDIAPMPPLLTPGLRSTLTIPLPEGIVEPLNKLHVTAFRDYLACPYRFYLKHVLRLCEMDDRAVEMDALIFGTVAHDVFSAFGTSELANSVDPTSITRMLKDQLQRQIASRFGKDPDPVVLIQRQLLMNRLEHFARWQAEQARNGWRIVAEHVEHSIEAVLDVDGEPFTVVGRIDRIDVHPVEGHRIIDYKTGDAAPHPEKTHRRGPRNERQWVDLQLPLYHRLAEEIGIDGPKQLGYVRLPKDARSTDFAAAEWAGDEIDEALSMATNIARDVRAQRFWPPTEPAAYPDGLGGICMDDYLNRAEVISRLKGVAP